MLEEAGQNCRHFMLDFKNHQTLANFCRMSYEHLRYVLQYGKCEKEHAKLLQKCRKRDAWYALVVLEQVMDAESVALDIFNIPLYSKVLHVVLALSEVSKNGEMKVRNSEILLNEKHNCDVFVRSTRNPFA